MPPPPSSSRPLEILAQARACHHAVHERAPIAPTATTIVERAFDRPRRSVQITTSGHAPLERLKSVYVQDVDRKKPEGQPVRQEDGPTKQHDETAQVNRIARNRVDAPCDQRGRVRLHWIGRRFGAPEGHYP